MFKHTIKLCLSTIRLPALQQNSIRFASTNKKWDLLSAVCLERHPVITKPMNKIEAAFQKMLHEIEFENSMKSDHELLHESDLRHQELLKKGLQVDVDAPIKQTAQDIEDSGDAELAVFNFAPRITEADKKNIKTSLERKLHTCLVLLVEQKIGKDTYWLPPQGLRADGETMRQAAERVLKELCGNELKIQIYGNAPMGVYKYCYPKPIRENGSYGAKVFYYLARYMDGSVPETIKHQWLDREELRQIMPPPIHKSVSMFLISE